MTFFFFSFDEIWKNWRENSATVEWNHDFQLQKKEKRKLNFPLDKSLDIFFTKSQRGKTQIVIVSFLFIPHRSTPSASFNQHIFKRGSNLSEMNETKRRRKLMTPINFCVNYFSTKMKWRKLMMFIYGCKYTKFINTQRNNFKL